MEILITSKTQKGKAACVGGLILETDRLVRLLNPGNWDQYADTDFQIGEVWDIEFVDRKDLEPPHIEDIIIQSKKLLRQIDNISDYIEDCGITIYKGSPEEIFDGKLSWTTNGSGYIWDRDNLPSNSVGFWISDTDLILDEDEKHYNYTESNILGDTKRFPYVGFNPKVKIIPKGTLMRISLARWWKPEDSNFQTRCYLQLSGWYEIFNFEIPFEIDEELPF